MKKIMIAVAGLMMAATVANAQIYLGGSVGFGTTTVKPQSGDKTTSSNWNVSPTIGYYLNDRFDIGMDLSFGGLKNDNATDYFDNGTVYNGKAKGSGWSVAPFARYSFFQVGRFEAIAKLGVGFSMGKDEYTDATNANANFDRKATGWGINVAPILAYSVTDHVVLYTTSNYLTLGYNSTSYKQNGTKTETDNNFGFNADATNVQNTGNIQIGFIYKF